MLKRGEKIELNCPEFNQNENIPRKFTCEGNDINPELNIKDVPEDAKSLVLIVDDPDAPMGTWTHWIVWDIPPTQKIEEDSIPGTQGLNDFKKTDYGGPCPPSGIHRYFFKLYALDTVLEIGEGSKRKEIEKVMENHVIESCELVGKYSK